MGVVDAIMDFRIRIDVEYQSWILLFASLTAIWCLCLPCFCAGQPYVAARRCAQYLNARLPVFFFTMSFVIVGYLALVLLWLPDWTAAMYAKYIGKVLGFIASHILKFTASLIIIVAFCFIAAFKDRIALMLGVDHVAFVRFSWRDCLTCWSMNRYRPVEIAIWKVEDLASSDVFRANNVFVEAYMGFNETMKSRVHHNAGSSCILKETMQFNFDEFDDSERLLIFLKNQEVMTSGELARLQLEAADISMLEQRQRNKPMAWDDSCFEDRRLIPRGKIWIRVSFVDDENKGSGLLTC